MFNWFKYSSSRPEEMNVRDLSAGVRTTGERPAGRWLPGRLLLALAGLVAALALAGCTSGTYPVDIFYEQHYQQSYKSHEPPRLEGVAGAVAYYPRRPTLPTTPARISTR